jgi:putative transposase
LIINQYKEKTSVIALTTWVLYPKSSWYYKRIRGKRGISPSTHTQKTDGTKVINQSVLEDIKKILTGDLGYYGYEKTTWELHDLGYIINKKKVYRLMKEANLLLIRERITTHEKRQFIQFRCINAQRPLEYMCMDIKYVYIDSEKRFGYLLTVMDVCTRFVLGNILKYSIKKTDVVLLLYGILRGLKTKGIIIRNDNGSQFLAYIVREFLEGMKVIQEFTHIASPEENSYIESLHSNLERELLIRNWFESIYHARMMIQDYYRIYNFRRKHRALRRRSPYQYIKAIFPDFANKHPFTFSDTLSRVALDCERNSVATCLALDKEVEENEIFVASENQEILLN